MERSAIFPLLLLLISCSILSEGPKEELTTKNLVFQTDQSTYTTQLKENLPPAIYGFTIIATFENRTDQTIYLSRCDPNSRQPIYGLKLLNAEESDRSGYSWFYACAGHNHPIAVRPGSVRIDTLHISGPNSWDHFTKESSGVLEGKFQLGYDVLTCRSGDGCDLPDSLSQSNEFEVRLAE